MKVSIDLSSAVYLLKGDDDVLLEDTAHELVHALVGGGDRTLMVEELDVQYQDVIKVVKGKAAVLRMEEANDVKF